MDLFQIEEYRRSLIQFIKSETSVNQKLLLINEFLTLLLRSKDDILTKAYAPEFSGEYLRLLQDFTPFYKHPDFSKSILENLKSLIDSDIASGEPFRIQFHKLTKEQKEFEDIICGQSEDNLFSKRIYFPVIELFQSIGQRKFFGFLEFIEAAVFESSHEDTFIIVPSEQDLDARLKDQIKTSWALACASVKKYLKISRFHRVIVQFQTRNGFYIGDSMGTALTVMFIKKLLSIYNSPYLIDIPFSICITGGIDNNGTLSPVSDLIIKKKVEIIFFSPVNSFVMPEKDMPAAEEMLRELQSQFPNRRKLKITGVKDINDLLDRRSILEIRRQNSFIRGSRILKRNWVPASLIILFIIIFGFMFFSDTDNNPSAVDHEGHVLSVLNKKGKVIWSENIQYDSDKFLIDDLYKIVDINNDGTNEVILAGLTNSFRISCFDNNQDTSWTYRFTDDVRTDLEEHSKTYVLSIIDTLKEGNRTFLYLIARNNPFYPSAIFRLDLLTGARVDSLNIFWHSGNISDALMGDFNEDGRKEIVAVGMNNCFEGVVIFSINADELKGQGPSYGNYVFKGIPPAKIISYTLLPKSDYSIYQNLRFPSPSNFTYDRYKKEFTIYTTEGPKVNLLYIFDNNLKSTKVNCGDSFEVMRDELVDQGELPLPYTNTREYFTMLKKEISYWNGSSFVKEF